MASSLLDENSAPPEGENLMEAWGLEVQPTPARYVDKLLVETEQQLTALEQLASQKGAESSAEAAKKLRKELADLDKKVDAAKKSKDLTKATEQVEKLLAQVTGELEVPVREEGLRNAIGVLRAHAGNDAKKKLAEFEKRQEKIAKEKDPEKRCDEYYQLEREVIQADLVYREQENPGSTWQTYVEMAIDDAVPQGKVSKMKSGLKGVMAKVTRSGSEFMTKNDFQALSGSFAASLDKKIADMAFGVPSADQAEFEQKAKAAVQKIAVELFADDRLPANKQSLGKLMMKANTRALQELTALKRQYPPDVTPQVNVQDGKVVVTKAAPKLESLVLQGGGGKGVGYPSMLEEMTKSGMLDSVDLLVGTSIGALNASCLACGGLTDERQILDLSLTKQAFDPGKIKKNYPDVSFGLGALPLPSCAGQMAKMDELTSASVSEGVKDRSENQLASELREKLMQLDNATLERLGFKPDADEATIAAQVAKLASKVKHQDFGGSDRTSQMITFQDLAILHQLEPTKFKELTITGFEGTGDNGKVVYFCAKDFPDMPVALAARISMGLPVFAPLYWKDRGPFFDGGIGSNAPLEAAPGLKELYDEETPQQTEESLKADVPVEVQEAMSKTMLMTFDEGGKANEKIYGQGRNETTPSGGEKATVMGKGKLNPISPINPKYDKALEDDAHKVYNSGVNTFQVFHGNLDTFGLGPLASDEDVEYAETLARMKGLEQIDQRMDQAVAVTCNSADEALTSFSDAEKRKFVAAGKPQGADPVVAELFDKCEAYLVLADAASQVKGGDASQFLNLVVASPLTADKQNAAKALRDAYNVGTSPDIAADALKNAAEDASKAIADMPAYLRPMLKSSVLIPLQQKQRKLGSGQQGQAPSQPSFDWRRSFAADAFETAMRGAAQKNVFLYVKEAQNVTSAFKDFEKAFESYAKKSKPKDVCKAAREALTKLEGLSKLIRGLLDVADYKANATMAEYAAWLSDKARGLENPLRSAARGREAVYPKYSFAAWDGKDWQRKKKEAIESGAIEDIGKTGFSDEMEKAVKAGQKFAAAIKPDDKATSGLAAWNAWDTVIRSAKKMQSQTENDNFSDYLEECVAKATLERNKYPPA